MYRVGNVVFPVNPNTLFAAMYTWDVDRYFLYVMHADGRAPFLAFTTNLKEIEDFMQTIWNKTDFGVRVRMKNCIIFVEHVEYAGIGIEGAYSTESILVQQKNSNMFICFMSNETSRIMDMLAFALMGKGSQSETNVEVVDLAWPLHKNG